MKSTEISSLDLEGGGGLTLGALRGGDASRVATNLDAALPQARSYLDVECVMRFTTAQRPFESINAAVWTRRPCGRSVAR